MANLIDTKNPSKFQYAKADWENLYKKYHRFVVALPQVRSGGVPQEQAENWLNVGAKLLQESELRRLIVESSGFTARDMRSLWAFKHGEYYPKYEASEVYRQKRLTAIRTPDAALRDEGFLKAILRQVALEKYGFKDIRETNSSAAATGFENKIPWAVKKDVLIGQAENTIFTYDVKVGYNQTLTHSDIVRHHFNHLALADKKIESQHSDQYNFQISPELKKTITDLAKQSSDGWRLAIELAKNAERMAIGIEISKERVIPAPEIYQTLISIGNEHWNNIKLGQQPEFKTRVETTYTSEEQQKYRQLAQQYAVSKMVKEVADDQFNHTRDELTKIVGIGRAGHITPHPLVVAARKSNFDLESAVALLDRQGIPQDFYKQTKYDTDALVKAAEAKGVDTSKFKSYGAANKEQVLNTLEMIGVSKDSFTKPDINIHISSQTRGILGEIKQSVFQLVEANYSEMSDNVSRNPLLNADRIQTQLQPTESAISDAAEDQSDTLGMG